MGDLGLGEQIKQLAREHRAPGGSSFSAFGRTMLSIGSGIADVLVVHRRRNFPRDAAAFLSHRRGQARARRQSGALALEAITESERALRLWLRGQLIAMIVVGLLTGFGLWCLGMPSAFTLGLLAGMLEFIPFAGPILSMVPAILLALAVSPDLALWVLLLYFAVQQFEGYVLTPLVQQYAVDLPGVVLLFALIAFGALFGTLGVILAAPLTVVSLRAREAPLRHRDAAYADTNSGHETQRVRPRAGRRAGRTSASARTARHCRPGSRAACGLHSFP